MTSFPQQTQERERVSRIIKLTGASPYESAHAEDANLVDRLDVGGDVP
jgi:hypothetical protein